jgi:hypothetical protein
VYKRKGGSGYVVAGVRYGRGSGGS